jgi:hypothetical protein
LEFASLFRLRLTWGQDNPETAAAPHEVTEAQSRNENMKVAGFDF